MRRRAVVAAPPRAQAPPVPTDPPPSHPHASPGHVGDVGGLPSGGGIVLSHHRQPGAEPTVNAARQVLHPVGGQAARGHDLQQQQQRRHKRDSEGTTQMGVRQQTGEGTLTGGHFYRQRTLQAAFRDRDTLPVGKLTEGCREPPASQASTTCDGGRGEEGTEKGRAR